MLSVIQLETQKLNDYLFLMVEMVSDMNRISIRYPEYSINSSSSILI